MTVGELIKRLQEFDPNLEVAIIDGLNGGGNPRTINFGPIEFNPNDRTKHFTNCAYYQNSLSICNCLTQGNDALDYSDLKSKDHMTTIHIGYGCY